MLPVAKKKSGAAERIIRDPEFAKRFASACDGNDYCPPLHKGRLTWVQVELERRFKEKVSVETVRKWFAGEARPRPDKLAKIAELLQVDISWLSLGVDKGLSPRELKARGREIEGAVNVVAGFIEMDGGHAAFASVADQNEKGIDLHAIIKGAKYDIHISFCEDGTFRVPTDHDGLLMLGVAKNGFTVEIYEITDTLVSEHGNRRGGIVEVNVPLDLLQKVETFTQRL